MQHVDFSMGPEMLVRADEIASVRMSREGPNVSYLSLRRESEDWTHMIDKSLLRLRELSNDWSPSTWVGVWKIRE